MMADTPTNTSTHVPPAASSGVSGGVGGNDPNVIPQWKKELIQRRKNLAKTIGAVATQVHDSASTVAAAISASSSPVTPHPRTPTGGGAFPVGSPFYAGVGTKEGGTTHSSASSTNTTNCGPLDTVPDSERQQLAENEENVVRSSSSLSAAEAEAEGTDKTDSLHLVGKGGNGGGGDGGGVKQEHEPRMVAIARDNNRCPSIPSQAATSPTTAGVHFGAHFGGANEPAQQQQRSSVGGSVRAAEAVLVPATSSAAASGSLSAGAANGPQSHSNAGSEHSGSSSSSCSSGSSTVAAAIAPATRPNSSSSSSVVPVSADREIVPSVSNGSVAKGSSLGSSSVGQQQPQHQQQQQQQREGGAARKMVAATAAEEIVVVYEKSSVLDGTVVDVSGGGGGVGVGGGGGAGAGGPGFGDAGEELKYGPGIVSRLRCRYLSLALRQSVTKQRPSLNSMRRATSLNNLLDEESEDLSEREQSIGSEGGGHPNQHHHHHQQQQQQLHQQHHHHLHHQHQQQQQQQAQQKKYHSQNYHYQQQQQQQQQREHYANGNGNNHNHNHNHLHQQQPPLHATVVLQPPYQKQQPQFAPKQPWMIHQHQQEEQQQQQQVIKTAAPFLRGVQNSYTRASRQVEKKNEYNRYTKHHRGGGGADAVLLKRARSVEALVRYDHHKAWERDATGPPLAAAAAAPTGVAIAPQAAAAAAELVSSAELGSDVIILDEINVQAATTTTATTATATSNGVVASTTPSSTTTATVLESNGISSSGPGSGAAPLPPPTAMMNGATRGGGGTDLPLLVSDCVTIEEKIINGREKGDPKPKRLTSFIDADERPPPDVVKQTMKIFEANANRRGGRANGTTGGPPGSEVASKVASYRSIIISGSATATAGATTAAAAVSAEKPPITHPKPPLSPKKPNIKPRTASPKHQAPAPTAPVGKPPPTPKSLEAVNNLKNSSIISNNNSSGIGSVTGPRNGNHGKQQAAPAAVAVAAVAESVPQLGTPPSPPARSKHAPSSPLVCSSNGAASVGAVVSKSMQSEMMGVAAHGVVVESAAEAAANAVEAKNNALKNGGGGCVRDHHNNYENGLTQTAAATVTTASKTAGSDSSGHQHIQHNATAQGASSSSSSSSSPPPQGGICESPSIQQLTSKLASLHLATSTPTGAGANGTTSPVNAASSAAQDRRNLEYVTSDEEEEDDEDDEDDEQDGGRHHTTGSYTVNPDSGSEQEQEEHDRQHRSKDARDGGVAGGSGNDADDDDDDGEGEQPANSDDDDDDDDDVDGRSVRKISRTAMENIARAGTTTQFRFNGAVKSSYLPGAAAAAAAAVVTAAPSTKPPAPPIPKSRESLGAKTANGAAAGNNEANGSAGRSPSEVAAGSLAGNSAVNNGGAGALGGAGARNEGAGGGSPLTRREIEKNQINREKSGEAAASPAPAGPNSLLHAGSGGAFHHVQGGGASASVGGAGVTAGQKLASGSNSSNSNGSSNSVSDSTTSFVAKWGTGGAGGQSGAATATVASPLAGLVARKKTKPPPSQQDGTNTMVFNFSDRKDVPDYIENDGVIIRPRPRELPKPGESGFVVLGDLTLETSTDPDDAWAMGPPSPCNGEFANAYIVINGKSSMRNKTSRSNKFKIQFDDSLTSTYEYPSETSLLEPNGLDDADSGPDGSAGLVPPAFATDNGLLSHTNKLLSSVPLGSAPFASYTPVKAAIDTTFELGVTRTPSPSAASTTSSTGSNGSHSSSSSNSHQSATSHSTNDLQHPHQQQQQQPQQHSIGNGHRHQLVDRPNNNGVHTSNGHSNGADALLLNGTADPGADGMNGTGEPESIQYLKPASDEQTVNWSQGTRVTDLLF